MFWRVPLQRKTWATVIEVEELKREGIPIADIKVKLLAIDEVEGRIVVLTGRDKVPEAPG
jgi:hypothetical protein